jgi:eukaryotic-like serine/threonine-protein kinase
MSARDIAASIRQRPYAVASELASFFDDWCSMHLSSDDWTEHGVLGFLAVARLADPDEFRNELRALPAKGPIKSQAGRLRELAADRRTATLPAPTAVLFAGLLKSAGDVDTAIRVLRQAANRYPRDPWVNYDLASYLVECTPPRREEAVRYYTAARSIRPETAHQLAHLLDQMGRAEEAEAILQDLSERQPNNPWHLMCLFGLLKERGNSKDADKVSERAIALTRTNVLQNPDDMSSRSVMAAVLEEKGELDAALASVREVIRLRPDAFARNWLGNLLRKKGDIDGAITEYREAVRLVPDHVEAHNSLGSILTDDKKDYASAVSEFREVVRLRRDSAVAHHNLGMALKLGGKTTEAIAAFREATRLDPKDYDSPYELSALLFGEKDYGGAIAVAREAIRRKPG